MALSYDIYYQVQKHTDLLSLVKQHLHLTPGRKTYKGACPFHEDQGQSLMVSEEKNMFKCFGCGTEGGPVEFLMNSRKLSLADAVRMLVDMEESNSTEERTPEHRVD